MARSSVVPALRQSAFAVALYAFLAGLLVFGFAPQAQALPSFARQTGQPCGTCHTDFPGLTPYGRRFKALGYTVGGGKFRTTPFKPFRAEASDLPGYVKALPSSDVGDGRDRGWVPPISMMAIAGFTHTEEPQPPPTAPYKPNDNVVLSPISFFWGGAITSNIGAFAQVTYNAPPLGGFPDAFGHTWTWDNTDVRLANSSRVGGLDVILGITANNNPTVQDLWNTTPAWTFPSAYAVSTVAPTPATKTLIDGTFAAHVGSVGGYAFINDVLYLEATAYRTLDFSTQNSLGVDPFGAPGLFDNIAPYGRVAVEPHVGRHWLMVGAFGMSADVRPWIGAALPGMTFQQADTLTDIGLDSQYQYQGDNFWLTLRGSWIHEFQKLDASFTNGLAANPTNELNTLRLQGSVAAGNDNRFVLTAQYFNTWGTPDPTLYAGLASGISPDSDGFVGELAYIPFISSAAPGWPWFNARVGLQYTWYDKFDGTTMGARDHNTVFLYTWLAL